MARINVKPQYKAVVNLFNSLTGSKAMWNVFQDCIEMIALSIQNSVEVFPERHEKHEKRYLDIIKQYSQSEMETIVKIYAELTKMLEDNPYQDLLGDLYMQLDMGSAALGQFFTPYHVSEMMAHCTFDADTVKSKIDEKGYITIGEPCIGGGANIIGYLKVLKDNGINYQQQCVIVGQDLSRISALMAYIVLSMLGCQAVIKIGDTLCNPYTSFFKEVHINDIWYTPMFVVNEGYLKGV